MAPLLAPRSVAVVGASQRVGSAGHNAVSIIRDNGFRGPIRPVNPRYDEIDGLRCYPSVTSLPEAPDLAILTVANERIEAVFDDAVAGGARAAAMFGSCVLAEDADPPLRERLRRKARAAGIPVSGGNSMGYANIEAGIYVSFDTMPVRKPGNIAFFAQSGTIFLELAFSDPRYRYNMAVSQGLEINGTVPDYMDYALDQPSTRAIVLILEAIRDPSGFIAALEKARARDVPVVVLKVARTAQAARFSITHSGALAGDDDAIAAVFEHHGVCRVDSLDELGATALLMSHTRRPGAGGLAAMFDSGGMREFAVDFAADLDVPFATVNDGTIATIGANLEPGLEPANPLDVWSSYNDYEARTMACLQALSDDPATAMVMSGFSMSDGQDYPIGFVDAAKTVAARTDKPLFAMAGFSGVANVATAEDLVDAGVPVVDGIQNAIRAVSHAFAYRDFRSRAPLAPPPAPDGTFVARWRDRLRRGATLDEIDGLALLRDFGIPAVDAHIAEARETVLAAAEEIGYPVALKTAMPDVHHKADIGGVRLGLADASALAAAYEELAGRLGKRVIVQPMVGTGAELALGMLNDLQFGPVVMLASGGTLIEILCDRQFAIPPFDSAEARRLLDKLKVRPLLDGMRGGAPVDIDAVADAIARYSVLVHALGDALSEIDVNPLIAGPHGCLAVDALVVPTAPDAAAPEALTAAS